MKKITDFIIKIPIFWCIIFFIIATFNLSAPLMLNEVRNNMAMLEEMEAGLNKIHTEMVVGNGQLSAESEVVHPDSENIIFILQDKIAESNYIHFQKDSVEININDHRNQIDYEESMNKDEIITSVQEQMMSATVLSILANAFISILISIIIFLVMLIASHYILRKSEKFTTLFRLLNPPYLAGGYFSVLFTMITNHYHFVYIIAVFIIGILYTFVLKSRLEASSNDFYFGKGDNIHELY
ncbi:hypothetical protein J9303_15720 [Bacillaceae bacterium Marseille-Q3522]|nr:hypothetical protein [Bacillaceae bacterium Marseille-Q3522]